MKQIIFFIFLSFASVSKGQTSIYHPFPDSKAITGQSNEVILFLDQMSSFMSSYANDATSEIPIYQLYAAEDNPTEIVLVAPKYFFNYSDFSIFPLNISNYTDTVLKVRDIVIEEINREIEKIDNTLKEI